MFYTTPGTHKQKPQTHTFPETYSQNFPALHKLYNPTLYPQPKLRQTDIIRFAHTPHPPPLKPHHHYHHQSRVRPFPSGSAQPVVAWEQSSPAHQALKAAPASSGLNPPLSVKRSCTCLKSILPKPPQQSCPATELLISAVVGLVFSSITRAPSGGATWGPRPAAWPENGPLGI